MRNYKRYRVVDLCLTFKRPNWYSGYVPILREATAVHFIYDNFSYFENLSKAEELQLSNTDIDWPSTAILLDKLKNVKYYHSRNTKFRLETLQEIVESYCLECLSKDRELYDGDAFIDMIYYGFDDFSKFLERAKGYDTKKKNKMIGSVHLVAPEFPKINLLFNIDKDLYIGINEAAKIFIPTIVPLEYVYSKKGKVTVLYTGL